MVSGMELEADLVRLARDGNFWELDKHGEAIVPSVRTIRSHGRGAVRRAALLALLYLGGEAALDPVDVAILQRLIRIKAAHDMPYAFDTCFNSWLTVPGGDQRGIMDVLGLTDAIPATYAFGETLLCHLAHGGPDRDEEFDHVFISPELNGWTVVRGPSCNIYRSPRLATWAEQLSERYGQAQAYFFDPRSGSDAWLVADGGRILRRYCNEEPQTSFGDPLPFEQRWLDHHGLPAPPEQLVGDVAFEEALADYEADCNALELAAALSIDPVWTGWPTQLHVRGNALIARTDAGVRQNVLRGCCTPQI